MDEYTKLKLRPILTASKAGERISEAESNFAAECWKRWPAEYKALHQEAVDEAISRINPLWTGRT